MTQLLLQPRRQLLLALVLIGGSVQAFRSSSFSSRSISSLASKNSDRAHIEKNLEDMMGNDWREFRAKLVHQEQMEGLKVASRYNVELEQHAQLSDLFSTAISSIFKSKQRSSPDGSYFDEAAIGIPSEDPFVSADELPLLIPKSNFELDKKRWAHEISHVEPGSVLIANEKLGGVFHQTVVLIIQHCERSGSIGVVINRPMDGDLLKIASERPTSLDLSLKLAFSGSRVTYGGPVLPEEFSILHGFGHVDGSTKLCAGVYVGGSEELMNQVRSQNLSPQSCLFVQGHAAWVPGQLSKEIGKGVWYTASTSKDFILRYADSASENLWAEILECMGGRYAEIASVYQGPGDRRPMP